MTLRSRCEALVREWKDAAEGWCAFAWDRGFTAAKSTDATALQSALDATADEGRDADWKAIAMEAARIQRDYYGQGIRTHLAFATWAEDNAAAIDAAMKEGKT
jgi:hypothetical protein